MTKRRILRKLGMEIDCPTSVRVGANDFRPDTVPTSLAPLLGRFQIKVISCLWWRTSSDWMISPRTIHDTMLFIPVRGAADVARSDRWLRCQPGTIALLPEGVMHAARYAPGGQTWDVIAVHVLLDDPWHWHFATGFADHVVPLPDAPFWVARFARLAGLLAAEPDLGKAYGADLVRLLLTDLLHHGITHALPDRRTEPRIAVALQAIDADPGQANVEQLARAAKLSPARFRVLFIESTGMAPKAYVGERQLRLAMELLRDGTQSIREIAAECGFCNDHYFHRVFKNRYGLTPSAWRASGAAGL